MEKLYEITDKGKQILKDKKKEDLPNDFVAFTEDLAKLFTHFSSEPLFEEDKNE